MIIVILGCIIMIGRFSLLHSPTVHACIIIICYTYMYVPIYIYIYTDIKCGNLSTPSNGRIMSCSSGRVGVGYEGDTCSFTCNTGYELTGSDTRICQSDGSWSGIDSVCRRGTYILYSYAYFLHDIHIYVATYTCCKSNNACIIAHSSLSIII